MISMRSPVFTARDHTPSSPAARSIGPSLKMTRELPRARKIFNLRAVDLVTLLLLITAVIALWMNALPTLEAGFYQDDYRLMDHTQAWGWDLWRAIRQDGYTLGFRPLNMLQHTILWNFFGENIFAHHIIRILIHLSFGGLLLLAVRWLDGNRLHAAVVMILYYSAIVTRATVAHWVMFTPSDILCLAAPICFLVGVKNQWSAPRLALGALLISACALFTKESGISASGSILLLSLLWWKRLSGRHRTWLFFSQTILLSVYLFSYWTFTSDKWMTLSEFSADKVTTQGWEVTQGFLISFASPLSAVYFSLRHKGMEVVYSCLLVGITLLGFVWILWAGHGKSWSQVYKALRSRSGVSTMIVLLIIVALLPYLPGRWFETRMLAAPFAMGSLLWGLVLGDALSRGIRIRPQLGGMHIAAVAILIFFATLAAGAPLASEVDLKEKTAARLRQITREASARHLQDICLVGFPIKGGLLRVRNAQGVIGYESHRSVRPHAFTSMSQIPDRLQCVVVQYQETEATSIPFNVIAPIARSSSDP